MKVCKTCTETQRVHLVGVCTPLNVSLFTSVLIYLNMDFSILWSRIIISHENISGELECAMCVSLQLHHVKTILCAERYQGE